MPILNAFLEFYPIQNGKNQEGSGLRFGLSGLVSRVGERRSHS